jgi:protein SCO1/2
MRAPNVFSRGLLAGTVLLAALTAACGGASDRRYDLKGQVLSLSADRMEASVKHEEIPDFMGAMTMPYRVRDAKEYAGLEPGDLITATLVVESNGAYLTGVTRVGNAPIEKAPDAAPPASSGFELLKPGEAVPMTPFVDQDGKPRTFESFKGSTVVLTFIYTSCPMPTFCPLMDRHFAAIQEKIKADPALKHVHLVTISFDPVTDTPAVLKKHAETLGADRTRWTFLTGDRDEVDRFAMRFGVSIARALTDPIDISHNLRTAIVDGSGRLVKAYTGNSWTPAEIVADLGKGAGAN